VNSFIVDSRGIYQIDNSFFDGCFGFYNQACNSSIDCLGCYQDWNGKGRDEGKKAPRKTTTTMMMMMMMTAARRRSVYSMIGTLVTKELLMQGPQYFSATTLNRLFSNHSEPVYRTKLTNIYNYANLICGSRFQLKIYETFSNGSKSGFCGIFSN
jgi:hypothetical protein